MQNIHRMLMLTKDSFTLRLFKGSIYSHDIRQQSNLMPENISMQVLNELFGACQLLIVQKKRIPRKCWLPFPFHQHLCHNTSKDIPSFIDLFISRIQHKDTLWGDFLHLHDAKAHKIASIRACVLWNLGRAKETRTAICKLGETNKL